MPEETEAKFYQPKDAEGNPLGLPIEYTDQKDLQAKLKAAAQRMKFVVSKNALKAPETAQRFEGDGPAEDQIRRDVQEFLRTTPSYHVEPSNMNALVQWINDNNLQPSLVNFRLAFSTLSRAGLLIGADGQPTASDDRTGISFTDASGKTWYGKQAVDRMPSETYKKRLYIEFGFKEKVERLLNGK